jgi:hypothetical protein
MVIREISMYGMDSAPHGQNEIYLVARRTILGLGLIDEPPFHVMGRFYPERGFWAAEDRPGNGMPSLGLIPLEPLGWYPC